MTLHILMALGAIAAGAAARDIPLYSQPTTSDGWKVGLGWYSQSEPRVRKNYKHADDFTLSGAGEVGRVVWWGQSSLHTFPDLRNFDSFQIEFFEAQDMDGQAIPGVLVASEVIAIDQTFPVLTGRQTPAGALEYRHEAALASPVALGAGRHYFIAISAGLIETDFRSDAWQWQDADLHDGWSGVYSWASEEWSGFHDSDSAFELYAVPAPVTAAPLGLGLVLLALRRR